MRINAWAQSSSTPSFFLLKENLFTFAVSRTSYKKHCRISRSHQAYIMLQKATSLTLQLVVLVGCLLVVILAQCPLWQGNFRDCTCGVSYRDQEVRCCTAATCSAPVLSSHNLSCPFECQNGGILKKNCTCQPGYFGLCCERGKQVMKVSLQSLIV